MGEKTFTLWDWSSGTFANLDRNFPSYLSGWTEEGSLNLKEDEDTHFGYVHQGSSQLQYNSMTFTLSSGMYFCAPGSFSISGGRGVVVSRKSHYGLFSIGGPVEATGRLRYIDGCTDSLLIPPVKKGDPCFNGLFFPVGIDQTEHTHPSLRAGMVVRGRGECVYFEGDQYHTQQLSPGMIFSIHPEGRHKFRTKDSELVVVAYHPDSDFGPEDECHPMINRTVVDGKSARYLKSIHTTSI